MAIDFNTEPYFDDYSDSKQYYKILFKPGRAVQARELTQLQTILQRQVTRIGNHFFKEGSIVDGAQPKLDDSAYYLKVKQLFGGSIVNYQNIQNKFIKEAGTGRIAFVKSYTPATGGDEITLHASIKQGFQAPFLDGTQFDVYEDEASIVTNVPLFSFETIDSSSSGESLLFHISEGVFYAKETFLFNNPQTAVVGKYSKIGSGVIGFDIIESIVEYDDDETLLDPAVGSSNYLAPGADRYKIDLVLTVKEYTAEAESFENFIEVAKVRNGELLSTNQIPIYDNLADTLARRTYDESGDYVVKNFIPYLATNLTDNSKLTLEISPGKAYVRGYEIEKPSTTYLSLNKSRSTLTDTEYEINTYYGNYTFVNSLTGGLPTINNNYDVEIHSVKDPYDSSTLIGTAKIKNIEYYSGAGLTAVYTIFLYDVILTDGSFSLAESIVKADSGDYTNPSFKAYIDGQAKVTDAASGETYSKLFEPTLNNNFFLIPQTYISQLADVEYTYKQHFYANSVTSSTITLTCRTSDSFATASSAAAFLINYTILNTTTGNLIPVDTAISYANTSTNQVEIVFNTSDFDGDNLEVIATVRTPGDNRRTKKLNQHFVREITVSNNLTPVSLIKSDVYELEKIYEIPQNNVYSGVWSVATTYETGNVVLYSNTSANISNVAYFALQNSNLNKPPEIETDYWQPLSNSVELYELNNGQKDNYYDHGTVRRRANVDISSNALVLFSYFTHDGAADTTGYISGESYPIDYSLIPSYVATDGTEYSLRDLIDFRPRRVDDTTDFSLENYRIPEGFSSVVADVSYYQRKIDKVVLNREGKFKVLEGIPAYKNPPVPDEQEDSITLYVLTYEPYTDFVSDVKIKTIPYKRYTMKDISSIDNRLSRVEYYTALNLLEEEVSSSTYVDENGIAMFKNGFLVDSFKGHSVGDVQSSEYSCSIDYTKGQLRPPYIADNYELFVDPRSNGNFQYNVFDSSIKISGSGVMTVGYEEEVFVNQPIASKAVSVNPFDVIAFSGTIRLLPQSDTWFDQKTLPNIVTNIDGENDNFDNFKSISTKWNAWQTNWSGEKILESVTVVEGSRVVTRETVEVTQQQTRTGTETLKAPPAVVLSSTTKVVDQSIIPYARSKSIQFEVSGMAPFVDLYLFINGKDMSGYMIPLEDNGVTANANVSGWSGVTTDGTGSAIGMIYFPNDENARFPAGAQNIVICDNPIDYLQSVSFAQASYFSQGLLETKQTNIVSTKGDYIVKRTLNQDRTNQATTTRTSTSSGILEDLTPNATYELKSTKTSYNEGETAIFELTCTNAPVGQIYTGNLYGSVSSSDIGVDLGRVSLKTTGTESLNKAYLSVPITDDLVDDDGEFLVLDVQIPVNATEARLKGALILRSNVSISQTRNETYSAYAPDTVYEGNTFVTTFSAANLYSNLTVNYSVGGTVDSGDFTGNAFSGTFTIAAPGGTHNLTFTSNTDNVYEAVETFKLNYRYRDTGNIITTTRFISDNKKTYVLFSDKSSVTEGESFTIQVAGNNLEVDENVAYVITGVTTDDLVGASLTGNIKVEANGIGFADFTTNNDGIAEVTESFNLTLLKSYPNDATITIPIYDTGDRTPQADIRVIGTPVFSEGSTIEFECNTRYLPEGSLVAYKILGVSGTKVITYNDDQFQASYKPITDQDISNVDVEFGLVSSQYPSFFTIGANGKGYANITLLEDQTLDGVKGGVIQLQDYTYFSNVYYRSGRLKQSTLLKKEAEFIILDTSNTIPTYDVVVTPLTPSNIGRRHVEEGEVFGYSFKLANTSITSNVNVNFSIVLNPSSKASGIPMPELRIIKNRNEFPTPVGNNKFIYFTSTYWKDYYDEKFQNSFLTTSYEKSIPNYAWYVDRYSDVKSLYQDGLDGGQRYSQLFNRNIPIFVNGEDQYNKWTQNAFNSFRRKANEGKAAFGQWHYTNYGKKAKPLSSGLPQYEVPYSAEISGNVTLTGTREVILPLYHPRTEYASFKDVAVDLLVNAVKDENGKALPQTAKATYSVPIRAKQENLIGTLDKLSRKPEWAGDFLDSRKSVTQILDSEYRVFTQLVANGAWYLTPATKEQWDASVEYFLNRTQPERPFYGRVVYKPGYSLSNFTNRNQVEVVNPPSSEGSLLYNSAGLTAQQVTKDPNSKGKIIADLSFISFSELNDLGLTVLGYYRSQLNRNPTLSGFVNTMNKLLSSYRDITFTSPAFAVGTAGSWGSTNLLFTAGTGTTGTLQVSGSRGVTVTWENSTMAYQRYTWYKRTRLMTIPKNDLYFIYFFGDDAFRVNVRSSTTGREESFSPLVNYGPAPGWTGPNGVRVPNPVYIPAGNYLIDLFWYNSKKGAGGGDFALFPSDQIVASSTSWRIRGGRTNSAWGTKTVNGISYKTFSANPGDQGSPRGDPGDSGTATYVYRLADDAAAASVTIQRNFQYSSDDITSSTKTDILNKFKSELQTKFTEYAKLAGEDVTRKASFLACTTDPVSQTFFVSEAAYPDGVFLTGVTLYFKTKDDSLPVIVEIRPTVNGYPSSSQIVPNTIVTKHHSLVNLSEDATAETRFDFDNPVYFRPGEYAIVVRSNSSKYFCWVSEIGRPEIGTTNIISEQPYVGSFFKSQNASTWTPVQTEDLCFKLHKAIFDTGNTYTEVFTTEPQITNYPTEYKPESYFEYHTYQLTTEEIDFDEKTNITYAVQHNFEGVLDSTFTSINANKNIALLSPRTVASNAESGNTYVRVTLNTTSQDISPVVDLERLSLVAVQNQINSENNIIIEEEVPGGGNAIAKYLTRRVNLAEGFDATGLRVIFDINRPAGSSVKVYYKVRSEDDTTDFDQLGYTEMVVEPKAKTITYGEEEYVTDDYRAENIVYSSNGSTYNTFRDYSIKIVMFTTNKAAVPTIKNLRAIALS